MTRAPAPPPPLEPLLLAFAQARQDRFVQTTIGELFADEAAFVAVPQPLAEHLAARWVELLPLLDGWLGGGDRSPTAADPIAAMAFNTRRFLKNANQFARLSVAEQAALAETYRALLRSFRGAVDAAGPSPAALGEGLVAVLIDHRLRLRRFVAAWDAAAFGWDACRRPRCAEYAPELQISILGLDLDAIAEPVLDLGCGERAGLVRFLRGCGVDASGVDAFAPAGEPFLARADWLAFPLGRERWGTVVSHLAFSHHFAHHLLAGGDQLPAYARRYRQILESLRPGGRFVYAPGLPLVEALLPGHRFRLGRRALAVPPNPDGDAATADWIREGLRYAAAVEQIG